MNGPILVIEDDILLREMVELMLAGAGHEVVTASDGQNALDQLQKIDPSLVLLDISTPGMSGLDVLDRMRRMQGWDGPVLVMTAHQDKTTAKRVLELGGDGFVPKPFTRDGLLARVDRALAAG